VAVNPLHASPPARTLVRRGAEAELVADKLIGRAVLQKRRLPKAYRHPDLDARLRASRTRAEANALVAARAAGVPVPLLYDADVPQATLTLEAVDGQTLREALDVGAGADGSALLRTLGEILGRLHQAGLVHGDLTTGNVLVRASADGKPGGLVLIDFGLAESTPDPEARGVDLHLLEEALEATRADGHALHAAFLDGYRSACTGHAAAITRLEAIRSRGRYR